MGPTWGPSGADRTQVGPVLAPWNLLSGYNTHLGLPQINLLEELKWVLDLTGMTRGHQDSSPTNGRQVIMPVQEIVNLLNPQRKFRLYLQNKTKNRLSLFYSIQLISPGQNGRHFGNDNFKCIFFNENGTILIQFSLKFVSRSSIDNLPALVQLMAWRRTGDKPLPEPMLTQLTDYMQHQGIWETNIKHILPGSSC